jgi:alcohol dehydrogenase, propanol-preferring
MRAMVLERPGDALIARTLADLTPRAGEVVLEVEACAVCRTDLHIIDGELTDAALPLIPGHEIVGRVAALADGVTRFALGQRVGVPWLGHTCGQCRYCRAGRENLCPAARFTGYHLQGGYAELARAHADFCLAIPPRYDAIAAAPLLCAGLIGYRTLMMAGDNARRVGIYGFGAAAHIVAQVALHQGRQLWVFTRPGDAAAQSFARSLGATWVGGSDESPEVELDAALIFAPVGELVPAALRMVAPGGRVVCGGIHMSDIPSFPYSILWGERSVCSVANLTRADGEAFMALAPRIPVRTHTRAYPLEAANTALEDLRAGRLEGAAVLVP